MAREEHIYRGKGGDEVKKEFEERYGERGGKSHKGGDYIYGAKVGELYRKSHGGRNPNQRRRRRR